MYGVLDRVQVALLRARVDDGVVGREVQRHAGSLEMQHISLSISLSLYTYIYTYIYIYI